MTRLIHGTLMMLTIVAAMVFLTLGVLTQRGAALVGWPSSTILRTGGRPPSPAFRGPERWCNAAGRGRNGLVVAVRAGIHRPDQRELHELAARQLDHNARVARHPAHGVRQLVQREGQGPPAAGSAAPAAADALDAGEQLRLPRQAAAALVAHLAR